MQAVLLGALPLPRCVFLVLLARSTLLRAPKPGLGIGGGWGSQEDGEEVQDQRNKQQLLCCIASFYFCT